MKMDCNVKESQLINANDAQRCNCKHTESYVKDCIVYTEGKESGRVTSSFFNGEEDILVIKNERGDTLMYSYSLVIEQGEEIIKLGKMMNIRQRSYH